MIDIIAFSCPLILASTGALFSDFAGTLALFLEGLITLSGFFMYMFTALTKSTSIGILLTLISSSLLSGIFALIINKTKADKYIAGLGMNILFASIVSLFSHLIFKTRGVLTSQFFTYKILTVKISSIVFTVVLIILAILLLIFTKPGIYFRITGSNPQLLKLRGIEPSLYEILSWAITGFFAAASGIILVMRISSFVPNISGGKGWMALAAVFLGKKKWWQIIIFVLLFCGIDFFSAGLQNIIKAVPSSVIISLPYLFILLLIAIRKEFI